MDSGSLSQLGLHRLEVIGSQTYSYLPPKLGQSGLTIACVMKLSNSAQGVCGILANITPLLDLPQEVGAEEDRGLKLGDKLQNPE